MFHGSTSSGALSTIESLAECEADFGREQQHGSRSLLGVRQDHAVEHCAHQATATRIAGEDQPFGCVTTRNQVARHGEDVICSRRERVLRRQPVVGSEDGTTSYPRQMSHEQRVHPR